MSDKVNVVCNWIPRPKLMWSDLTDKEREELDYVPNTQNVEDFSGFRYRGEVYDLHEFEMCGPKTQALGFSSDYAQSNFDAVVVQEFDKEGNYRYDEVVVGHIHW